MAPALKKRGFAQRHATKNKKFAARNVTYPPTMAYKSKAAKPKQKIIKKPRTWKRKLQPKAYVGSEFFDAANARGKPCISALPTLGAYVPLHLLLRNDETCNPASSVLLLMTYSNDGVAWYSCETETGVAGQTQFTKGNVRTNVFSEIATGSDMPLASRPSRKTMKLKCDSRLDTINGQINVVATSDPVLVFFDQAGLMTEASVDNLVNMVRNSPQSKAINMAALVQGISFSLGHASVIKSSEWTQQVAHNAAAAPPVQANLARGSTSTLIVEIPKMPADQMHIEISVFEQLAAKFATGHLLSSGSRVGGAGMSASEQRANRLQAGTVLPRLG